MHGYVCGTHGNFHCTPFYNAYYTVILWTQKLSQQREILVVIKDILG